jgi:RNA polymerase sigma-70 factor, ECF subfamily
VADPNPDIEAEISRLQRYARALTRDLIAADDLVQDCLTRALGKSHLWQQGTDLRAWLFTILHNQYIDHVRRTAREGTAVGLSEREPLLARAPQQGGRLELRDLERAITRLPWVQRSVILLVGLEGMSYGEVAAILDVPVGTVRSRLSRAREALRQLTGIGYTGEADTVRAGRSERNRPIRRFDGAAGRSDIAVNRGRRVAGDRTNAGQRSGIRASKDRMGIAQHNRTSRLPGAGIIGSLAC